MTDFPKLLADIASGTLHDRIAKDAGLPSVVHCRACGRSQEVDPGRCLAKGWPKCCGSTMTIDAPGSAP